MGKVKLLNQYLLIRYCELTILNSCLFENPVQKTDDIQAVTWRFYRKLFHHSNPKRWHMKQRLSSTKRAKGYCYTVYMYFARVTFIIQLEISTEFIDSLTSNFGPNRD